MKSLSIKNVPEAVHRRLKQRASRHHRSLNGELLALIEEALCSEEQTHTVSGSLSEFLLNSPLRDSGLSMERDRDPGREVAL